MVRIIQVYFAKDQFGNTHSEKRTHWKFYDTDEVPDDLNERVQRWANYYDCAFEIQSENSTTTIFPDGHHL